MNMGGFEKIIVETPISSSKEISRLEGSVEEKLCNVRAYSTKNVSLGFSQKFKH